MSEDAPIVFTPFDLGLGVEVEPAGRMRLTYEFDYGDDDCDVEDLTADFGLGPDFSRFVRLQFAGPVIFRSLDETWLSLASASSRWKGDLSTFARTVSGDSFTRDHKTFFHIHPESRHYQFVTGSACLDVIAAAGPRASIISQVS